MTPRGGGGSGGNPSLLSDLARVLVLGVAFDAARFVAGEFLGAASSSRRGGGPSARDDDADRPSGIIASEAGDDDTAQRGRRDILASLLSKLERAKFRERCRRLLDGARQSLPSTIGDDGRLFVGMCVCSCILLPPPLLLYGAWHCLPRKNNGQVVVHTVPTLYGMYLSAVITSIGSLSLWMRTFNKGSGKASDEASDEVHDKPTVGLNKVPRTPARPPLVPISNENERRPRSGSMQSTASECSVDTKSKSYLEILVHNVSHTDLILGLSGHKGWQSTGLRGVRPPEFPAEFEDTPRKTNAPPRDNTSNGDEEYILCRPRFSAFDLFTRRVLGELRGQIESMSSESPAAPGGKHPLCERIISYPRYERSGRTARYTLVTPRPSDQSELPIGFNLEREGGGVNNTAVDPCEMPNLRLRGRDIPKLDPSLLGEATRRAGASGAANPPQGGERADVAPRDALRINAVFFPLLAALLPRWLGQIADKYVGGDGASRKKVAAPLDSPNVKKVVVLVSGVGTPRNWTHSISGNSTQTCAELMELFIRVLYPDVKVVRIHSETNIFRYDENISFAKHELMPCIDSYRDAHARGLPYPDERPNALDADCNNSFNPDWRQTVSVTYSFADGSAARSHAIQASLRPYRPTYFHFWQLKTFWHETKITDEDIEVHSFEEMETVPAMAIDQTSETVMAVVSEMKTFRKDFLESQKNGERSDLSSFWLRKTKKPVLAVLLVQKPGGKPVLYRGTNMEVSMPTGSLCAERNVIGTALANDPGLKREDLIMIAVLSLQLPSPPPGPPICRQVTPIVKDGVDFSQAVGEKLKQHQLQNGGMLRSDSRSSIASIAEDKPPANDNEDWEMDVFRSDKPVSPLASPIVPTTSFVKGQGLVPELNMPRLQEMNTSSGGNEISSGQSTPKRRIHLYQKKSASKIGGGVKRQKQSFLVHSLEDMNPLKPCGACNEWLKKIAESNPHFKVLTFTDERCNGVYCSPCQD